MTGILGFENILWAVTMLLAVGLAALMLWQRNFKTYPLFFAYVAAVLMQNLAFVLSYRLWGFSSAVAFRIGWSAQGLVTLARALAVAEICHRILAKFPGIWGLAWQPLSFRSTPGRFPRKLAVCDLESGSRPRAGDGHGDRPAFCVCPVLRSGRRASRPNDGNWLLALFLLPRSERHNSRRLVASLRDAVESVGNTVLPCKHAAVELGFPPNATCNDIRDGTGAGGSLSHASTGN